MNEQEQQKLLKNYGITIGYLRGLRRLLESEGYEHTVTDITELLKQLGETP